MTAEVTLRAVLALLCVYHLGIGIAAVTSPRLVSRVAGALYSLQAAETPQLRYGVRMLGLYALALGTLLAFAAWDPRGHVEVIVVTAGLQLARAVSRLLLRHELSDAFGIPARRNALNAAVLLAEAGVLGICLLYVR